MQRTNISVLITLVILIPSFFICSTSGDTGSDRYASGDYAGAIDWYEAALLTAPQENLAGLYNNIGVAYSSLGDAGKAIEAFSKAVEVDPTYGRGYINLGSRYEQSGETDSALAWYLKAADMDSSVFSEAVGNAGDVYAQVGKNDEAVAAYLKAGPGAVGSVRADIYNGLGAVYMLRNLPDNAEKAFLTSIEADPEGAALAHTNLGVLRVSEGRYDDAMDELITGAGSDPEGKTKTRQYLKSLELMMAKQVKYDNRESIHG